MHLAGTLHICSGTDASKSSPHKAAWELLRTPRSGDCAFSDYDNDGDLDIAVNGVNPISGRIPRKCH
jgi:hypothetical protein